MTLAAILDEIMGQAAAAPNAAGANADGVNATEINTAEINAAEITADDVYERFEAWVRSEQGLTLYPAQEEALLSLAFGDNVILATPTGTGKSLVALGAHFIALSEGRRTVYTA
ncbi:MAG: hypothetical protein GX862_03190, partial [Leucobacter sp.]|nr:hypothetical protein [Leucobacter sp.]